MNRYEADAFRLAYLILRDTADAEDVAQDAFVRAYLALSRFRLGEPFLPWLLRIVTNLAVNRLRARSRRLSFLARYCALRAERVEPAPDHALLHSERHRTLWRAVGRLKPEQQTVIYLRYFLDLPEKDLAACLGCPAGTVKPRLHRALRRLRDVVERDFPELAEAITGDRRSMTEDADGTALERALRNAAASFRYPRPEGVLPGVRGRLAEGGAPARRPVG